MAKSKKSKLKANFAKANFETDFFIPEAKKTFIYLQKAFTEALILRYFDPECHIWIKADVLGYVIGEILSQMISDHLDQLFFNHVTHKNLNPIFS